MEHYRGSSFRPVIPALLIALLAFGCASPRTSGRGTGPADARQQVERCLRDIIDAAEAKDFARLDAYHLYGPQFTKFSGTTGTRLDAEAAREGEHKGLSALKALKMRIESLQVDVFGDVAIATFILDYAFEAPTPGRGRERSTLVFVKAGGTWKITHEHLSAAQE